MGKSIGIYFEDAVVEILKTFGRQRSRIVNKAVKAYFEAYMSSASQLGRKLGIEAKIDEFSNEEAKLFKHAKQILRSGAHLDDAVRKLLLGDKKELDRLAKREGIYAHVDPEEQDAILRMASRRKEVAREMISLYRELYPPQKRYVVGTSNQGVRVVVHEKGEQKTLGSAQKKLPETDYIKESVSEALKKEGDES